MSKERISSNQERERSIEQPSQEALEHQERLREMHERSVENKPERNVEKAKHEALEQAKSREKETRLAEKEKVATPEKRTRGPSKKERDASFKRNMTEVQKQMSGPSRAFSKVIHNKAVEKVSDVAGSTVARPNAILSGAVAAFLLTLIILLVARHFGYPLSGFESIAAFALGWVLGLMFDFFKAMITGKS